MTASLEERSDLGLLRVRQKLKAEGRSSSPEGTLHKARRAAPQATKWRSYSSFISASISLTALSIPTREALETML